MRFAFVLFVTISVVEMWVLIRVGSAIGTLSAVALVVLTAMMGVALLKRQGVAMLFKVRHKIARGELPAQEIVEGMMLAVGGALLLTPGFITDCVGFCCLVPGIRAGLFRLGAARVIGRMANSMARPRRKPQADRGNHVIEGEYRRDD